MLLLKARSEDLPKIKEIYDYARRTIGELGIDQWQDGYPEESVTREDLKRGELYVCKKKNEILGVSVIVKDGEPTYDKIYDGAWLTDGRYIAVHRFAVAEGARHKGVGTFMLSRAEAIAKEEGFPSLRIDTHEGNIPMRNMLSRAGLLHCGTIYLGSGDKRVAYEKKIKLPRVSKRVRGIISTFLFLALLFGVAAVVSTIFGSACPSYLGFKICCPFCGMTRAHLAALRFDFEAAFHYHPAFFLGIPLVALVAFDSYLPQKYQKAAKILSIVFFSIIIIVYLYRIWRFGIDFFN